MRESSLCIREPALGVGLWLPVSQKVTPAVARAIFLSNLESVSDTQYQLGLETWSKGLNLSPENIDA